MDIATQLGTFFLNTAIPTGTVINLIPISQNTHGLIIRTLQVADAALVVADVTAPSGYGDTTVRPVMYTNGDTTFAISMPYPLAIPAGLGVWAAAAPDTSPGILLTWDVVTA